MKQPKNKKPCEATIFSQWSSHKCGKVARMEHEGKHYCGIHDPVKRKEKQAERDRKWREEHDAQALEDRKRQHRRTFGEEAIELVQRISRGDIAMQHARRACDELILRFAEMKP